MEEKRRGWWSGGEEGKRRKEERLLRTGSVKVLVQLRHPIYSLFSSPLHLILYPLLLSLLLLTFLPGVPSQELPRANLRSG